MRRIPIQLLVVLGLAAMPVLASVKIEVARQAEVDYSIYESFSFRVKGGIPPEHPLGEKGDLLRPIRDAAREELQKRGMVFVQGGEPDLWVTFFGLRDEELSIEGTTRKVGPVSWVGDPGAHSTRTVLKATLIVEMWDADSGERIWSGWATGETTNPEKLRSRADRVTRRILKEFPSR